MPVTAEEISSTLTEYLLRHSGEAGRVAPLTAELTQKGDDPAPSSGGVRRPTDIDARDPGEWQEGQAGAHDRHGYVFG
jgi:hypothetical protein